MLFKENYKTYLAEELSNIPNIEVPFIVIDTTKRRSIVTTDGNNRYIVEKKECYPVLPPIYSNNNLFIKYVNGFLHWREVPAHLLTDKRLVSYETDDLVVCSGAEYTKHPLYRGVQVNALKEKYKSVYLGVWNDYALDVFAIR